MTSTKSLPAALRALAILSAIFLLSAGCWMFREIDACETDRDCAEGEVCYNSSGILVCLPEAFLAETDDRDAGAEDAPRSDSNDLIEDTRPGGDASDAPATDDIGQDDSAAGDLAAEVTEDLGRDLADDARLDDLVRPDDTGGTDSAGDVGPCDGGIVNDCGGCGVLSDVPGEACGPCGLDEYVCDLGDTSGNTTACEDVTYGNGCDGCGTLLNDPGDACGSCGLDAYVCDGTESTVCDGDTRNDCGGCALLDGVPDEVCSCGGQGDAVWQCDGTEAVVCSDDNDTFDSAEFLGNFDESGEVEFTRWLDSPGDVDVYRFDLTEDLPGATISGGVQIERTPNAAGNPNYDMTYGDGGISIFYRYNDLRGANIVPFGCGFNGCVHYDASSDAVDFSDSYCSLGSPTFNPTEDLYGCRGIGPDTNSGFGPPFDLQGATGIQEIDSNAGENSDDRGAIFVLIDTSVNEAPSGCESYRIVVTF